VTSTERAIFVFGALWKEKLKRFAIETATTWNKNAPRFRKLEQNERDNVDLIKNIEVLKTLTKKRRQKG